MVARTSRLVTTITFGALTWPSCSLSRLELVSTRQILNGNKSPLPEILSLQPSAITLQWSSKIECTYLAAARKKVRMLKCMLLIFWNSNGPKFQRRLQIMTKKTYPRRGTNILAFSMKIVWLFSVGSLSDSGRQRFSDSTSQQIPGLE